MSKTIINSKGEIVFYSVEDFYQKIIVEDNCIICGAEKGSKEFNNEHVLPNWILKKYKLHDKGINLPNATRHKYNSYTIPCCKECNTTLGNELEIPVSRLLNLSYEEICDALTADEKNMQLLFDWLMLIYFKVHVKDKELNWNLDRRKEPGKIFDVYEWESFHHIHCMIRRKYTNAIVDPEVIGSIVVFPVIQHEFIEPFDWGSNASGASIMIRLDEFCIVCVLNDSCAANILFRNELKKINSALAPIQIRELLAHFTYININLKERPVFFSRFNHETKDYYIKVQLPKMAELKPFKERTTTFGELLFLYCVPILGEVNNKEDVLKAIEEGHYTFLFDEKGNFFSHSDKYQNTQ